MFRSRFAGGERNVSLGVGVCGKWKMPINYESFEIR